MSEKQASGMAAATPILISTRRVRLPGTCFLAPDTCNGVAVRASLLPRYQESGIRDQGSEMVPDLLRLRLSANARDGRDLLPDPCFLISDKG